MIRDVFFLEFKIILIFSVVPDNKVEAGMYFSSWNVWLYKNGQFPDLQKYFILLKHCYIMQIMGLCHFPEYTFMKMNQIPSQSLVYNNFATSKTGWKHIVCSRIRTVPENAFTAHSGSHGNSRSTFCKSLAISSGRKNGDERKKCQEKKRSSAI